MNTNADITLYSKWYDRATRTDRWIRTQIRGVSWYGGQAATVGEKGLLSAGKYTVRIPLESAPAGKQYVAPEAYAAAASSALAGLWTLQNGDIIVRGLQSLDITGPTQATALPESFTVMGVSDNRRGSLQHWKVVGA
jgi:hypothetical protein